MTTMQKYLLCSSYIIFIAICTAAIIFINVHFAISKFPKLISNDRESKPDPVPAKKIFKAALSGAHYQ